MSKKDFKKDQEDYEEAQERVEQRLAELEAQYGAQLISKEDYWIGQLEIDIDGFQLALNQYLTIIEVCDGVINFATYLHDLAKEHENYQRTITTKYFVSKAEEIKNGFSAMYAELREVLDAMSMHYLAVVDDRRVQNINIQLTSANYYKEMFIMKIRQIASQTAKAEFADLYQLMEKYNEEFLAEIEAEENKEQGKDNG